MKRAGSLAVVALAFMVAALAGWLVSQLARTQQPSQVSRPLAGLPLTAVTGSVVAVEGYRGKVVVLVLGCVSCWAESDSVLSELGRALMILGRDADEIQVLVVSVAPERDTAEDIETLLAASDPRFVGLVGSPDVVRHVEALGLTPDDQNAAAVAVLDQRGDLRFIFPFRISAPSLAEDLAALLRPVRS